MSTLRPAVILVAALAGCGGHDVELRFTPTDTGVPWAWWGCSCGPNRATVCAEGVEAVVAIAQSWYPPHRCECTRLDISCPAERF